MRLEVQALETGYGKAQVLFGVDLEVEAGELVALLGANGAGKTTLLRALSGLLRPWKGSVLLGGRTLGAFPRQGGPGWVSATSPRGGSFSPS